MPAARQSAHAAGATLTPVSGSGDPSGMADATTVPERRCPRPCRRRSSWGSRDVAVEDRPTSRSRPGDVLLEVSHCGVCGSDLHFLLEWGGPSRARSGPRVHRHGRRGRRRGRPAGRSATGRRRADRRGAATCEYCLAGRPSLCVERGRVGADDGDWQGAFAGYKTVPAAELLRVPDGLVAEARRARPSRSRSRCTASPAGGGARPGTRWLVTGGGPIGFLSVAALQGAGRRRHRRERAARRAAARCASSSARAPSRPTSSSAPAMPHDLVDEPFDVALECSGNGRRWSALAQLKRAGTLVLVGAGHQRARASTTTASC